MSYDIIGDIHGHADALEALLTDLGYRNMGGAWRHLARQALFVGDFIDRGPKQMETVSLVRRMVDAGSARAVMGNHEFNAIAWFLPDPECPGEFLRKHHSAKYGDKNRKQHQAFLSAVEGSPLHEELVMWFLTLPVCLDLPDLRVIHACWHVAALEYLRAFLTVDHCLKQETMILATREPENEAEKDTPEMTVFKAVEAVLKGVEVPLPAPHTIRDKDGHDRNRVRVRWWDNGATDYRCAAMLADHERAAFPDDPVPPHALIGHDGGKPVFIGHYWLTGAPELLSNKVACVDYSVAKGGKLVAYRWDGEPTLDERKLHWVRP
ncbi:MAG TPA: metallophosphoesterase [Nitrospira sp.]|uniref:Metallophosphoesterase n=2 Tax=Candidatus Accumulibacter TaxID=327159 RepID=A0A7D5SCQ0_9PROT|nr:MULTISPECIES: metallophosphoesterase [Candidatus Accumulibacter]QLH48904.1 MAG: metallophosphoesterase [Candidatus Accumulibacter cognatus]HUM40980.1 metallophosphoesterase [Nitrospira sp.]MBL8401785.1 metallophosphoesterase [Accumulibacter sp.]MBN8519680.1 metallophosphoesterase [Accumulibacter sp.]MBO3709634.1 metallophosphoesterase [Accumulibacter sp.]